MRPHIYRLWGVWNCRTFIGGRFQLGCGYSPTEAYDDWKKSSESAALTTAAQP